ncbi:MAG: N(2)-fixation sustaining protein CowN [Rhodospirillaceae bacterium]|nr:N(2)-fixation sustaining protein CowN [Rhodospirillaceae bacterium]
MTDTSQDNFLPADRYVSFCNIDCSGMAVRLLPLVRHRLNVGGYLANPFWKRFDDRVCAVCSGLTEDGDALYLVCSHVMYLAEIFEDADGEGHALLEEIEQQCC